MIGVVHEYRRFIQSEIDARNWDSAELARRSGLHRQLIWKVLHDSRDHLGQMPKERTLEALARGFGIPIDRVRSAASRSLDGYSGEDGPVISDATRLSTDVLIEELRRRVRSDGTISVDNPEEFAHWGRAVRSTSSGDLPGMGGNQQSG